MADRMKTAATAGVTWNYLTLVLGKATVVLTSIVLARLLAPAEFGLVTLGLLVVNYLTSVQDLGVGAAVVRDRRDDIRTRGTALAVSAAVAVVLAFVAYLAAPLAAGFFGADELAPMVRVLAVSFVVAGLASVPRALLQRRLDFRRRLLPELGGATVKCALTVGLAMTGAGPWCLVWGTLGGTVVATVAYFAVAGWTPRPAWDPDFARRALTFGLPVTAVALLAVALANVDYVVIGKALGDTALGYYMVAYRLPELVVLNFLTVASQVLFPSLSLLRDDPIRLRRGFLAAMRHITAVTTMLGGLLACAAHDIVVGLFGATWEPAVDPARLLGLYMVLYAFSYNAGDVYKAAGRPWILTCTGVGQLLLLAPLLWYASGFGITGVAAAMVVFGVIAVPAKLGIVVALTGVRVRDLLHTAWPVAASGCLLGLAVTALDQVLPQFATLPRAVVLCLAGVAVYVTAMRVTAPSVVASFRGLPRQLLASRSAAARQEGALNAS